MGDQDHSVENPCMLAGDIEVSGSVVFVGTGSHDGCSTAVRELMGLEEPCMLEPCAMYGRYMPAKGNMSFYAFNAFFYAANNLGLVDEDEAKVLTLGEIREATQRFCCRPWAKFMAFWGACTGCSSAGLPSSSDSN